SPGCRAWPLSTGCPSQFAPPWRVPLTPAGRLLADPTQVTGQFGRPAQLCDGRVEHGERAVGVGGVDHAVALRTEQGDVLAGAALLPRQAVVLGQLRAGEQPAAKTTIQGVGHERYHFGPPPSPG